MTLRAAQPKLSYRAVFLIGAQKGGSSYLHNLLVANGPFQPARIKEPHYFTSNRRLSAFESLFDGSAPDKFLLDSSTSYIHNPDSAARISTSHPDAPIIAVLRPPQARIVSAYRHLLKHGCETRDPREVLTLSGTSYHALREEELDRARHAYARGRIALRRARRFPRDMCDRRHDNPFWNFCYVSNSLYATQLQSFRNAFPRLLVLTLPDLAANPGATLARALAFLGLPCPAQPVCELDRNSSNVLRSRAVRSYLANVAADHGAQTLGAQTIRSAWRLATRDLGQRSFEQIANQPWIRLAETEYHAALQLSPYTKDRCHAGH